MVPARLPKITFIQPNFIGYGGLESYGAHFISSLSEQFMVDVVSRHKVDAKALERTFSADLSRAKFIEDARCHPAESKGESIGQRLKSWLIPSEFEELSAGKELIISQSSSLPPMNRSKKGILLCHFPVVKNHRVDESISVSPVALLQSSSSRQQREIRRRLGSWHAIIANSKYTSQWIQTYWKRDSTVIHPPVEIPASVSLEDKQLCIVSAGFFSAPKPGNAYSYKKQELLIDAFKTLKDQSNLDVSFHLAGHLLESNPEDVAFFGTLRKMAAGYPIHFHANCSYAELTSLYRQSSIFWHASGFDTDVEADPANVEHFGIVIAEAMGWGALPVAVAKGGVPEVLGPLREELEWNTREQLVAKTGAILSNEVVRNRLARIGIEHAQQFSVANFRSKARHFIKEAAL